MKISLCITDTNTIRYLDQRIKDSKWKLNNIQIEECEYNPLEHKNVSYSRISFRILDFERGFYFFIDAS